MEDLLKFDEKSSVTLAPKLTKNHIYLKPFSSMRVKLATQIFSHSIAAGILFCTSVNVIDSNAIVTAKFIDQIDKLFNTFNSNCKRSKQPYRHALSNCTDHLNFLDSCLDTFRH